MFLSHILNGIKVQVCSPVFRTPAQFLEEVLLVDDFSDKEDLGEVIITVGETIQVYV